MAHLPWRIRTRFWVPRKFFFQEDKYLGIFWGNFLTVLFDHESVYSDNSFKRLIEVILIYTLNILLFYRRSKRRPYIILNLPPDLALWLTTVLELPMSRTNFHGPKAVRATAIRESEQNNLYVRIGR